MKRFSALVVAVSLNAVSLLISPLSMMAQESGDTRSPQCNPANLVNGFGRCNYGEDFSYFGYFQDGLPNGRGTLTLTDGTRYDGEFVDGRPNGDGRLIMPDDVRYEGTFREGSIVEGAAFFANGDRYQGDFTQVPNTTIETEEYPEFNNATGQVEIKQRAFFVTFYSSQPDGVGQYIFTNGNRYEGEFFSGQPFGLGTFFHTSGTVCDGYFFTRNMDGRNATCTYPNGDSYVGELRQGRPHGTGTITKADGTTISGVFRDGQPVSFSGY